MAVRINLLPKSYQPPRQMGAREWVLATGVAAVLVAGAVYYMNTYAETARMEAETQASQAKLATVKTQLTLADSLKAREDRVTKAEQDLKALAGRAWSPVLLTLRDLTPQNVQWQSLKVENNTITLKANGKGLLDVAQLFGGLVDHDMVESVSLHYVDEKGSEVTVTQSKDAKSPTNPVPVALDKARQMEFELVITLVKEGGQANATQPS